MEEVKSSKEKISQLGEDLQLAQKNLEITVTERDILKDDLELAKEQTNNLFSDFEKKKADFEKTVHELEFERDELVSKVKFMEDEKVVQNENAVEIQTLLEEKIIVIERLERRVNAMKNGFIWLQGIKEKQSYVDVSFKVKKVSVKPIL